MKLSTDNSKIIVAVMLGIITVLMLTGCQNTLTILDGATHACGNIHVEGYLTDSQGEVRVMKLPVEWTAEQVNAFCPQ